MTNLFDINDTTDLPSELQPKGTRRVRNSDLVREAVQEGWKALQRPVKRVEVQAYVYRAYGHTMKEQNTTTALRKCVKDGTIEKVGTEYRPTPGM